MRRTDLSLRMLSPRRRLPTDGKPPSFSLGCLGWWSRASHSSLFRGRTCVVPLPRSGSCVPRDPNATRHICALTAPLPCVRRILQNPIVPGSEAGPVETSKAKETAAGDDGLGEDDGAFEAGGEQPARPAERGPAQTILASFRIGQARARGSRLALGSVLLPPALFLSTSKQHTMIRHVRSDLR